MRAGASNFKSWTASTDVLAQREVLVRREGRRVILEPADEWSVEFRACLGSVSEAIPRPKQAKVTQLRNPFD